MKEWLWLTFFPQEDSVKLIALRSNLTPFLKAVTRALTIELEESYPLENEKKDIFNEILQNLPAENSTTNISTNFSQVPNTLQDEFDQLKRINIQ